MKQAYIQIISLLFVVQLIACGGGGDDSGTPPPSTLNIAPTVNAGNDQTVNEQITATLIGSGSDPDGTIVSYSWTQTAGENVIINNSSATTANFDTPTTSTQLDGSIESLNGGNKPHRTYWTNSTLFSSPLFARTVSFNGSITQGLTGASKETDIAYIILVRSIQ